MSLTLQQLIDREKTRLEFLRAKAQECESRLETLHAMQTTDVVDEWLARGAQAGGGTPAVPAQFIQPATAHVRSVSRGIFRPTKTLAEIFRERTLAQEAGHEAELPRRRLSDDVVAILRFVGRNGASLDELETFCHTHGFDQDRAALRSMMSSYKARHGFIQSPEPGYFTLTDIAIQFLDERYPLAQGGPPSVAAEGGSIGSTEAAKSGGTELDDLI